MGKVYVVSGEERGLLRIVDDSGEDFLYPREAFVDVEQVETSAGDSGSAPGSQLHDTLRDEWLLSPARTTSPEAGSNAGRKFAPTHCTQTVET